MKHQHLINKLRALRTTMFDIAADLEHFGGFNPSGREKSRVMLGAASIAKQWADEMEAQTTIIDIDQQQEQTLWDGVQNEK